MYSKVVTGVMEGHHNEGSGQNGSAASFTGLYDGERTETGGCDLFKHTAGGVHDEDQCRRLLDAEETTDPTQNITHTGHQSANPHDLMKPSTDLVFSNKSSGFLCINTVEARRVVCVFVQHLT